MASSSSNEHHHGQRPARLVRQNSSFIGAIKNIVKAPLNWFAHQDDSEATPGKRRRQLDQEPTEEFIPTQQTDFSMYDDGNAVDSDDDTTRQTKRMRLHSPPKRTSQPYLDPPAAALRRADPPRRSSIVPRASSAVLPSSRATLSPRRHIPVTRTMSIDPPRRSLVRRESSAFNFGPPPSSAESDYDMAVDSFRDISMPPSPGRSSRPSFRMRSSVTPQPQQPPTRYISEPPPLNSLVSNPVFLQAPTQPVEESAPTTLGSLVQSHKTLKSPTRQHSSLFLASAPVPTNNENKDAPAERALHQLDIYKTPLLPTRMRSSNLPASVTATTTPDMFKSRRKSNLVLMQDDRDRLGRKGNGSSRSPVVNETKPYAGEGGMKKLLARRKQEAEEEETDLKTDEKDDERTPRASSRQQSPVTATRVIPDPPAPAPAGADWFSTAASAPSSSSSASTLRVGRTTNRTHLARPAKARFSAKFDEEAEVDDTEASRTEKRREMAEEAAKMVPLFKEPPGFSFSLEVPPMEASKDDDPNMFPITSLPFAISRSSVPSSKESSPKPFGFSSTAENKEVTTNQTSSATNLPLPAPVQLPAPEPKVSASAAPSIVTPAPTSNSGLPDFFATSKILKETKLPTAPVLTFAPTSSAPTTSTPAPFSFGTLPPPPAAPAPAVNKPTTEPENPFWDGGAKQVTDEPKSTHNLFSGFGKKENNDINVSSSVAPPASLFGGSTSSFAPVANKPSTDITSAPSVAQPAFSFSNPSASTSLFGAVPSAPSGASKAFDMLAEAKPASELAAKPMFSGNFGGSAFGDSSKVNGSLFRAPTPSQPAPAPPAFSFGTPPAQPVVPEQPISSSQPSFFSAAATPAPPVETSKSLFVGSSNTGFSFAQPAAQKKEEVSAPFSFGAPPATPPTSTIAAPKPAAANAFSFGQPSTTPATTPPISFSFSGGGSTTADVSSKPLFSFGQSTATVERPVTPPKNGDNEFRMEESPTRELQQANSKPLESRPTIGAGGFSFGGPSSGGSLFGQSQASPVAAPAPFSFGSSTFPSKENKPEESKPFGGFGQTAPPTAPPINTSFSFSQNKPAEEPQRPSSGGGFSFGTTPTSTTVTNNAFSFGTPAASNPFGQPAPGSAPSSPSTFSQPSPFAFGASAPSTNGGFSFGSQPASPAAGGNLSLPPSGFASGGGFGQAQPSSPFSGPIALAPSTSGGGGGGSLFTIGSAPAAAPGGARAIKKLPNRRGGTAKR